MSEATTVQVWTDTDATFVPNVTIRQAGTIAFSRGAQNKFQFGTSIQHVKLAYDFGRKAIVVIPAIADDSAALELKRVGKPLVLYCRKFFERFEIDFSKKSRFTLRKVDLYPGLESNVPMYVIDLDCPIAGADDATD